MEAGSAGQALGSCSPAGGAGEEPAEVTEEQLEKWLRTKRGEVPGIREGVQ